MDEKMKKRKSIRSQITIFIILALLLVVLLILFFLLRKPPEKEIIAEENPQAFIESCTREAVEEAISILLPQGGDLVPKGFMPYEDVERTYLCYTNEYYDKCVNQRPMLIEHLENEITRYITPHIRICFTYLESKLKKRYDVETSDMKLVTSLYPDMIIVDINKTIKLTRDDKKTTISKFKMNMIDPLYNLGDISMEIVNQEIKYCDFNYIGFMITYPRYSINRILRGDGNVVYFVKDNPSGEEFVFAIRNCVMPAGY